MGTWRNDGSTMVWRGEEKLERDFFHPTKLDLKINHVLLLFVGRGKGKLTLHGVDASFCFLFLSSYPEHIFLIST